MHMLSRLFRTHQDDIKLSRQQEASQVETTIEGRRHRIDTSYLLPKDDIETNRLDFQHHALQRVLGANYKAPIDPDFLRSILDVGTGTGQWVMDLAREYPHSRVVGIDIEAPPAKETTPLNCVFYEGDILKGLPFPNFTFDYVHQRLLVDAIPAIKWPFVISELVRVTRPGGWVELLESGDVYHRMGPAQKHLKKIWDAGIAQAGFDLSLMPLLNTMLIDAKLGGVKLEIIEVPLGKWAGHIGEMMGINIYHVTKGLKGLYTSTFGMSPKTFDDIIAVLPEEWENNHTTYEFYIVYGQK